MLQWRELRWWWEARAASATLLAASAAKIAIAAAAITEAGRCLSLKDEVAFKVS